MYRNTDYYKILVIILLFTEVLFSQTHTDTTKKLINGFNIDLGITVFKNPFYNTTFNNDMPVVSKAGLLGFELYNAKYKISLYYRKTYWLSLSASNPYGDINGLGVYDYFGINKYYKISRYKYLYFNLSYVMIRENGFLYVPHITRLTHPSNLSYINNFKPFYNSNTADAISAAIGYGLSKHFYAELRCNYYINVYHPFFKIGISDHTIQLSVFYKLNRDKKN